ncbi:MAG: hypothetical protein AB7V28_06645 [Arcobacteraceae bacterium]|jgi:FlaA1/EpsC-like NDP-sugar epimerase
MRNIILILLTLIVFTGCRYGEPTYEEFVHQRNFNAKYMDIPKVIPQYREIYSEDKYIYIYKNSHKGCVYGYLTNRDNNPEKVIGWIILSGKEYCKEQKNFTFQI